VTQICTGTMDEADHKGHIPIAFDVPAGTTRLLGRFSASPVRADGAFYDNLISLSLFGPGGPRGARHNNPVRDFAIEAARATPGYLPGPIEAGRWTVVMDTFRVLGRVDWRLEIECDTAPVPDHAPFVATPAAPRGPGWYRGDLHAHTLHSDGSWDIADLVAWARGRGLDFMTLTDHNTPSGHAEAMSLGGNDLLTMGGIELTTHYGHALSLGRRDWQEWRTGAVTGRTMPDIAQEVMAKEALFIIAHPMSEGDPACTGCRWEYDDMRPGPARIVEIWNGGPWADYNETGLALYREWLAGGHRLVATAGTDIHGPEGGEGPLGLNHVWAEALTEAAILAAVSAGRNYLSSGPLLILSAQGAGGKVIAMGGDMPAGAIVRVDYATEDTPLTLVFHDGTGMLSRLDLATHASGQAALGVAPRTFVMAELRDAAGLLHAVTNPIFVG
jgi:hypothetical protein